MEEGDKKAGPASASGVFRVLSGGRRPWQAAEGLSMAWMGAFRRCRGKDARGRYGNAHRCGDDEVGVDSSLTRPGEVQQLSDK